MQKRTLLGCCFLLLASFLLNAQSNVQLLGWQLKRVGINHGGDKDMLHTMDHNYFLQTTAQTPGYDFANLNTTDRHIYGMLCENPHFRLTASLTHPLKPNLEWDISLLSITNRIDEVEYATPGFDWANDDYQSLRFTQYTNEFALESTIGYRLQKGMFFVKGAIGANLGMLYDGTLETNAYNITICDKSVSFRGEDAPDPQCTTTSFHEYSDLRDGFSARAFGQAMAGITLWRRVDLGFTMRYGYGGRFVNGAPGVATELHSNGVVLAWNFR